MIKQISKTAKRVRRSEAWNMKAWRWPVHQGMEVPGSNSRLTTETSGDISATDQLHGHWLGKIRGSSSRQASYLDLEKRHFFLLLSSIEAHHPS